MLPAARVPVPGPKSLAKQAEPPGAEDVRVVIVDDSAVVRHVVADVIEREEGVTLVAMATNGREALKVLETARPHVVVLDVEMPVLDGLGALRELKKRWPTLPVIMFSTLTERGAAATLQALAEGADDYMTKPVSTTGPAGAFEAVSEGLVPLLRSWGGIARARQARQEARARTEGLVPSTPPPLVTRARTPVPPSWGSPGLSASALAPAIPRRLVPGQPMAKGPAPKPEPMPSRAPARRSQPLVAAVVIGSSTGGPNALGIVVPSLPGDLQVPVFVVQHMPPTFTKLLAERLDAQSVLGVHEGAPGMVARPGHVYVAPGGSHMVVGRSGQDVIVKLDDGPPENSCKPSVDVLFRSAAATWGAGVLGVILTGMGQDGLVGARAIVSAGGVVLAQDEASSVVWGMPGAVVKAGLAAEVPTIGDIAANVVRRARRDGPVRVATGAGGHWGEDELRAGGH